MHKSYSYLLLLSGGVSAHTWLEALRSIGSNGAFTGELGYPRGFVARTDPKFSDDAVMYRITAKDASTPLCHPAQQVANGYANSQFPRLNASAGSFVALTYQENGHVSAPQVPEGRPYRSGNVYVYATTTLRDEKFLAVHGNWTVDGSLESGRLLATRFYDDENCYQNQGSGPTPINAERKAASDGLDSVDCQTDIKLPEDIGSDTLALYWVWNWSLFPNMDKTAFEAYTACVELDISPGGSASPEIEFDDSVPLNQRAVQSQLATQFEVFELGTGTAAPPLVTSLYSNTASAASPTTMPTKTSASTVSETNDRSGFTTILTPSATVTVTVTETAAPSA